MTAIDNKKHVVAGTIFVLSPCHVSRYLVLWVTTVIEIATYTKSYIDNVIICLRETNQCNRDIPVFHISMVTTM